VASRIKTAKCGKRSDRREQSHGACERVRARVGAASQRVLIACARNDISRTVQQRHSDGGKNESLNNVPLAGRKRGGETGRVPRLREDTLLPYLISISRHAYPSCPLAAKWISFLASRLSLLFPRSRRYRPLPLVTWRSIYFLDIASETWTAKRRFIGGHRSSHRALRIRRGRETKVVN